MLSLALIATPALADHSWGGYHWARTQTPFTLKLGDDVDTSWDAYLASASSDWNQSTVLRTAIVPGATNPKNCKAVSGRVETCNSRYGNNGWLGIATIWINGAHITRGTVKLNDTYFKTGTYNTPAWRRLVACQEVAHTFGLTHQDEAFSNVNLGSCMDYTNAPAGGIVGGFNYGSSNEHPNAHDFEQLVNIYAHLDSGTTLSAIVGGAAGRFNAASVDTTGADPEWGRAIHADAEGRANVFEKDLGNGQKKITHVFWAPGKKIHSDSH